jgi:serine/threonine-protein kinase HipA
MNCKICLAPVEDGGDYHSNCIKELFGKPNVSPNLSFNKNEFNTTLVPKFSKRVSLSGVQPKLPIKVEDTHLVAIDVGGTHILKPAPEKHPGICENEHVSMLIGRVLGLHVAKCGLVNFSNGELAYIIKRFDREEDRKIPQEDMAQILGRQRDDEEAYKYQGSYEEVGKQIYTATGNNLVAVWKFYDRLVYNYLISNGDWHLKNISLRIINANGDYQDLTPIYDSLNTRLHLPNESSDLALNDLFEDGHFTKAYDRWGYYTAADFLEFAEKLGLNQRVSLDIFNRIRSKKAAIFDLVNRSYMSEEMKKKYVDELDGRYQRLLERSFVHAGP